MISHNKRAGVLVGHEISKFVKATVIEEWDVDQTTGEPEITDEYNAYQSTNSEWWRCTCGRRFRFASTAVRHVKQMRGGNE